MANLKEDQILYLDNMSLEYEAQCNQRVADIKKELILKMNKTNDLYKQQSKEFKI